jgi:hypothetical protein
MAPSSYKYKELSSGPSFRLFRIEKSQPSSNACEDIFSIHLFEASFNHPPEFEAISYAWGQEPASSVVACNGKQLHVTPNVEAILSVLSAQRESVGVFWIDSICIDQSNVSEKNIQVPRMRSIYSAANLVWIYLGEGSFETRTAFNLLLEVDASSGGDEESLVRVAGLVKEFQGEITVPRSLRESLAYCEFSDTVRNIRGFYDGVDTNFLVDLLNLPWFHRTWPMQELALAKKAVLICGNQLCPWSTFSKQLYRVEIQEHLEYDTKSRSNPASYFGEIHCYRTLIACLQDVDSRPFISDILETTRPKLSSIPEDKIFGLYGIFDYMQIGGLPEVDYGRPVHMTYTELTAAAIWTDNSLDILYQVCLPNIVLDLPSWVPDYSNASFFRPIAITESSASGSSFAWYSTSGLCSISGAQLSVKGVLVDHIREVATSTSTTLASFRRGYTATLDFYESEHRRTGVLELIRTLQAWVTLSRKIGTYPAGIPALEAFHSILIQNAQNKRRELFNYNMKPGSLEKAWEQWMTIITADFSANPDLFESLHEDVRDLPDYSTILADYSRSFGYDLDIEKWPNELKIRFMLRMYSTTVAWLQHEIFLNTYHKTFLVTRDGYMGTCPRWAEAGDSVVLIAGLQLPFIVRKAGEHYRLIGPAYIEGIMDGERWDERETGTLTFI